MKSVNYLEKCDSWFVETDTAVQFLKVIFWCIEHHKPSAFQFYYIWEKADISTANISKTHKKNDLDG